VPGVPGQSWLEQEDTEQNPEFDVRAPTVTYGVLSNHLMKAVIYSLRKADGDCMESVIVKNPKILGGTPVFRGTRVPLQLLFGSLERGHTLEEFLAGYPTVSRELAIAALEEAQQLLSANA
jgi:uncharacterized protein (DUF433 family)